MIKKLIFLWFLCVLKDCVVSISLNKKVEGKLINFFFNLLNKRFKTKKNT